MQPVKRIEIVVDSLELSKVLKLLEKVGVSGYTIIREVTGKGERGIRGGDELTGVFKNSYVLAACSVEQADQVIAAVRPVLKRFGGICLVSDAVWVKH